MSAAPPLSPSHLRAYHRTQILTFPDENGVVMLFDTVKDKSLHYTVLLGYRPQGAGGGSSTFTERR